jgi:Ca2+:H+ antiporter
MILQPLLVMTGLAFLIGGFGRAEQHFNARVAQTIGMLLLLAVLSLTIPTVSQIWAHSSQEGIMIQSRGTAIVIMISYILWLLFQLKTNRALFDQVGQKLEKKPGEGEGDVIRGIVKASEVGAAVGMPGVSGEEYDDDEEPAPRLGFITAVLVVLISTAILAFNTQLATDSIQSLMAEHGISNAFMGIVILPILNFEPEPLINARRDKMDMSLSLTLEHCMQSALMVVPLIILIAWGMGIDNMTLDFDGFSVAALFASVIIVTYVVQEGKSNWYVCDSQLYLVAQRTN